MACRGSGVRVPSAPPSTTSTTRGPRHVVAGSSVISVAGLVRKPIRHRSAKPRRPAVLLLFVVSAATGVAVTATIFGTLGTKGTYEQRHRRARPCAAHGSWRRADRAGRVGRRVQELPLPHRGGPAAGEQRPAAPAGRGPGGG